MTTLKQRLSAVTAGAQEFRVKSEREMQTFRYIYTHADPLINIVLVTMCFAFMHVSTCSQKYHAGNKSLKEKVKELQKNLQVLRFVLVI